MLDRLAVHPRSPASVADFIDTPSSKLGWQGRMLQESDPMAIVNATFRALKRRSLLAYLPLDEKEQVFAEVSAACGAIGWYDFVDALSVVARLLDDSYKIAEHARDLREPDEIVIAKLEALYPGLSPDVLGDALSHGWFSSR